MVALRSASPEPSSGPVLVARLGHDGDGCVETSSGPVFVRGALPGDTIEMAAVRRDGSITRADLLRVVVAGPGRIEPACPIATRCGGCPLMHASLALETAEKRARVERALGAAGLSVGIEMITPEPALGYRVRARLRWKKHRGKITIGYRAAGTDTLVDVEHCVVFLPRLDSALGALRAALRPLVTGTGEIHLGLGASGPVARIESPDAQSPALYAAFADLVRSGALGGGAIAVGGVTVPTSYGEPAEVARDLDGRALRVPLGGFRQAHEAASAELGRTVVAWAGLDEPEGAPLRVLELYAGHGNFTLPLAARAAHLVAVEQDAAAAAALRENLAAHRLEADVIALDAAVALERKKRALGGIDVVVLDPPRTGARESVPAIAALKPAAIVYVSCEPRTLARDVAAFATLGYVLEKVKAVNCFPRTSHVEAVARLVRA